MRSKAYDVPTILQSLKRDVNAGEISLYTAACELHSANRIYSVDTEDAIRVLDLKCSGTIGGLYSIGGPTGYIVPVHEIRVTEEEKYFLAGILHGSEEYLLQVYGWSNAGNAFEHKVAAKYILAADVIKWANAAENPDGTLNAGLFSECMNMRYADYIYENDGSGEFYTINSKLYQAKSLSNEEIIAWAKGRCCKGKGEEK